MVKRRGEADLLKNEVWSLVAELTDLLAAYNLLGLARLASIEEIVNGAAGDYEEGRYEGALSKLASAKEPAYDQVMESVSPTIGDAMKSPRDSPVPLTSISKISTAKRMYDDGRRPEGNQYLLSGLEVWAMAVPESPMIQHIVLSALLVLGTGLQRMARRSSPAP